VSSRLLLVVLDFLELGIDDVVVAAAGRLLARRPTCGAALLLVPLAFLWFLSAGVAVLMLVLLLATPPAYSLLDR